MSFYTTTIYCHLGEVIVREECSGFFAEFSIAVFVLGLLLSAATYRFYRKRDFKDNRREKIKIILLISGSLLLLGLGLVHKPFTVERGGGIQPIDIQLSPIYEKNDEMLIQVLNKGDRAINVTNYSVYYGPPNFDLATYSEIRNESPEWAVSEDGNQCFTSNMSANTDMESDILTQGERAVCSTGMKFPDALETVEIRVEADNFDYSTEHECSVGSSDARTC